MYRSCSNKFVRAGDGTVLIILMFQFIDLSVNYTVLKDKNLFLSVNKYMSFLLVLSIICLFRDPFIIIKSQSNYDLKLLLSYYLFLSWAKNVYVYISNIAYVEIYLPGNFVVLLQSKTELTGSHNAHSRDTDLAPSSTHLPLMKQYPSCQMYIIMDK